MARCSFVTCVAAFISIVTVDARPLPPSMWAKMRPEPGLEDSQVLSEMMPAPAVHDAPMEVEIEDVDRHVAMEEAVVLKRSAEEHQRVKEVSEKPKAIVFPSDVWLPHNKTVEQVKENSTEDEPLVLKRKKANKADKNEEKDKVKDALKDKKAGKVEKEDKVNVEDEVEQHEEFNEKKATAKKSSDQDKASSSKGKDSDKKHDHADEDAHVSDNEQGNETDRHQNYEANDEATPKAAWSLDDIVAAEQTSFPKTAGKNIIQRAVAADKSFEEQAVEAEATNGAVDGEDFVNPLQNVIKGIIGDHVAGGKEKKVKAGGSQEGHNFKKEKQNLLNSSLYADAQNKTKENVEEKSFQEIQDEQRLARRAQKPRCHGDSQRILDGKEVEALWDGEDFVDDKYRKLESFQGPLESSNAPEKSVQIFGLQNSGTALLRALLFANFGGKLKYYEGKLSNLSNHGDGLWPHVNVMEVWHQDHDRMKGLLVNQNISSIFVVRNPYSWLQSMRDMQQHMLVGCVQGEDWLTRPCFHRMPGGFKSSVGNKTYPSIVGIWNSWVGGYSANVNGFPSSLTVTYEDLVSDPKNELKRIADFLSVQRPTSFTLPDDKAGKGRAGAAVDCKKMSVMDRLSAREKQQACKHVNHDLLARYSYEDFDCATFTQGPTGIHGSKQADATEPSAEPPLEDGDEEVDHVEELLDNAALGLLAFDRRR